MPPRRFESPSSINTFKQCPRKYYYRYIEKLPSQPSIATTRGRIVHSVLEKIFDVGTQGVDKGNCREFFRAKIQDLLVYYWNKSRQDFIDMKTPAELERITFQETMLMLLHWADYFSSKLIQHPDEFRIALKEHTPERESQFKSEELFVQGFIDAVENISGKIRVMDYKTSKKDDITDEYRLQLAIYALLYKEKHSKAPDSVGIYFLKDTSHTEISVPVDQELMDLARLEIELLHMQTVNNNIIHYPKKPGPLCKWSSGQCDYYDTCFSKSQS
ncbi:MAG: PD-(D/E)XK nuclease family protein [Nanoarchaeota archaeon]